MMLAMSIPGQTHQFMVPRPPNGNSELSPKEHDLSSLLLHQCRGFEEFKQIHAQYIKFGLDHNSSSASTLLKVCALAKWGGMDYSHKVFQRIEDPTSFEFNTLVRGYVKQGPGNDPKEAVLLYTEMLESDIFPDDYTFPFVLKGCSQIPALKEGTQIHGHTFKFGHWTDQIVQNSLINMYGKCGELDKSFLIFKQMGDDKDITSWNSLLASYTKSGLWRECLELYDEMSSLGWKPNESTLVSILTSCTHLGVAGLGRCAHAFLLRSMGEHNMITQTALIDMYVKCGCLNKGLEIFRRMSEKNAWTYSVMISGLAMHGEGQKSLWLFRDMVEEEGLEPDEAICVGVLSACSHAGLLAEGLRFFDRIRFEHGINPTLRLYSCMVDLIGRAGKLQQAYEFIMKMPIEPDDSVWRSFLSACRVHNELEFAEIAQRKLLCLDPHTSGDYILMANIYSRAGKWDDAAKLRTEMVNKQLQQTPGLCTVEVNMKLHTFVSHDKSHAESKGVYEMLCQMDWQLRFEGYSPDTTLVLHCVDEDDKIKELGGHSQKLAIAYALISTEETKHIKIFRNLRMCSDCHTYTKLVSKIFSREITIRDRKRFHHFRDGVCSCRDYW